MLYFVNTIPNMTQITTYLASYARDFTKNFLGLIWDVAELYLVDNGLRSSMVDKTTAKIRSRLSDRDKISPCHIAENPRAVSRLQRGRKASMQKSNQAPVVLLVGRYMSLLVLR